MCVSPNTICRLSASIWIAPYWMRESFYWSNGNRHTLIFQLLFQPIKIDTTILRIKMTILFDHHRLLWSYLMYIDVMLSHCNLYHIEIYKTFITKQITNKYVKHVAQIDNSIENYLCAISNCIKKLKTYARRIFILRRI